MRDRLGAAAHYWRAHKFATPHFPPIAAAHARAANLAQPMSHGHALPPSLPPPSEYLALSLRLTRPSHAESRE